MQSDLDLIIIGAGCAGLSLGVQLAKMNKSAPKTLLLEKRKFYENDRTWCFWGREANIHSEIVNHQWTKLIVQSAKEKISLDCSFSPYQILSSKIFYEYALQSIKLNSLIDLKMDSTLLKEPEFRKGWWHFETSFGPMRTKSVVDTRPKALDELKSTKFWQSFLGYEIECDKSLFDPNIAVLMDFYEANQEFIGFNYVLPESENRALIEFTVFGAKPYFPNDLQSRLDQSIKHYLEGENFKILRTESGLIPMGLGRDNSLLNTLDTFPTYIRAGLTAGAARPATGYAFQRIQNWAIQCAKAISKNGMPISHKQDSFLIRKMDDIFLNVIRNNPELGPELFIDLFAKVHSKKLIRFLSDTGNLLDYFAVIKALPAAPFLKHIFDFSYA